MLKPRREQLRDPARSELLAELADSPYSVARLLRVEHLHILQELDDDIRASKRIAVVSVCAIALNIPLSLFLPWLGVAVSFLGTFLVIARRVYEWRRGKNRTGKPSVQRSLALLGGAGELPVAFINRAEGRTEPPHRPFLAPSFYDDNESETAQEIVRCYRSYRDAAGLAEDEQEVFDLLKADGFAGSLAELTETARNLSR